MTQIELQEVLKKHAEWLDDNTKGERADFTGADFTWANFTGADLTNADFTNAKLNGADFTNANLINADFTNANFTDADLTWANFTGANFTGADLTDAELTWANFTGADFTGADLTNANFTNANLSEATGLLSPIEFLEANFKKTAKGYIVYKCFGKHFVPNPNWTIEANAVLTETVNPCRTNDCGCGINVATLNEVKGCYLNGPIWKCLIEWKWLAGVVAPYNTCGKIRCEKIRLLEVMK